MATAQNTRPMELEGSLKAFKFPEILQFLAMGRMKGVLSIEHDERRVQLAFRDGKIIGAESNERCARLGQMLVNAGKITRATLDEALESQAQNPTKSQRLGEILFERGLLDVEAIKPVLSLQIEEEIWELFSWDDGWFRFEQGEVRDEGKIPISLNVETLLLEGSRRMDEWQAICTTISNPKEVYRVNPDISGPPEAPLDLNTWRVLSLVNGRMAVEAIVRLSNLGKFETYWALDRLLRGELIVSSLESTDGSRKEEAEDSSAPREDGPAALESPFGGESLAHGDDGEQKGALWRLFGGKKRADSDEEGDGTEDSILGSAAGPAKPLAEYFTDVGLVCAVINKLIDQLSLEPGDPYEAMWSDIQQHFPKSDLIDFEASDLSPRRYERYINAEGGLSKALEGSRDDSLMAMRAFWERLSQSAESHSKGELIGRTMKTFLKSTSKFQGPEFSLVRWRDEVR